jgi:hypothetical protein
MNEKTIKKIKKILLLIAIFVVTFIVSLWLVNNNIVIKNLTILEDSFVVNFLGTSFGLAIAIITFLYTAIDKLKENIKSLSIIDNNSKFDIVNKIKSIFNSLKDDTIAVFVFFIIALIFILLRDTNLPIVPFFLNEILDRDKFVICIKLDMILLTLTSLLDILLTLSGLLKSEDIISNNTPQ